MSDSEKFGNSRYPKILILGAPRSGTTWLGKIFDSHPEVLYRHEPDSVRPNYSFPFIVRADETDQYVEIAHSYLDELCLQKSIRCIGKPPFFKKNFNKSSSVVARKGIIDILRLGNRIPVLGGYLERIQVPDFITQESSRKCTYAIKSVISLGRAGLYQKAIGDGRIVFILRHPCGFVASELRGFRSGKMKNTIATEALVKAEQSEKYGLTVDSLEKLDIIEQLAWSWTIFNEKALADLKSADNVTIVSHDDLCHEPKNRVRVIFEECGLAWDSQTECFLTESSSYKEESSYYDVHRNSATEAGKWRKELDDDVVQRVLAITKDTPPGHLFFK